MAQSQIPDELKADVPPNAFGKILAATPVVMTVVATLLAGLASSEMTSAQYDRSLAAQQQSKAGDQWSYFQAKRLRGALQQNALEIVRATAEVHPLDVPALKEIAARVPPDSGQHGAELLDLLGSAPGQTALSALSRGGPSNALAKPNLDPKIQAAIDAIVSGRPDSDTLPLVSQLKPDRLEAALGTARERAQAFDAAVKPLSQTMDGLDKLLFSAAIAGPGKSTSRDFAAARLGYEAQRYEAEARLNQAIGNLYEVQVHLSNFTAERHRVRSQRFFYGMLIAQAAVIVSTLAMAARRRSVLWSVAAGAGLIAVAFAIYVYVCV